MFKAKKKTLGPFSLLVLLFWGRAGGDVFYFPSLFQRGRQWEGLPLLCFPFQSPRDYLDQHRNSPERVEKQTQKNRKEQKTLKTPIWHTGCCF